MVKGHEVRQGDSGVDPLFLDRWSARAMSGETITVDELTTLFEAARWAPSASNLQPWRILYARRDTLQWPLFFELLNPTNQVWCAKAAALVLFISKLVNEQTGRPIRTHSYDTGAAWENFALQGARSGLIVHGMQGFNYDRARELLQIPEGFQLEAMAAVGRPGRLEDLPEHLRAREKPSGRKPLAEIVIEGLYRIS